MRKMYRNFAAHSLKHNKLSQLVWIGLISGLVAYLDYLTPQEVPIDAFYALPIWLGLLSFGWKGGLGIATSSALLFYLSNYLLTGTNTNTLALALILNYGLFLLFTYGAYRFLNNQRQLDKAQLALQTRLEELNQLYHRSEELHQQNLKLAVIEERNRLAREIHDVLAQGLMGIILQVEAAQVRRHDPLALEERLSKISELAHHNLQEARRSVANLRPLPLDGRSLEEALESKVAQFGLEQQLETTFKSSSNHESHPLTVEVENGLYRIAQEALSNAARHAQASRVEVTLDYDEDEVCLTIQDNGCGFELDAPSQQGLETSKTKSRNFGLSTMQERASLIGGWITIQSAPGQGCRVRVIVPYFKAPAILDKVTDLADQAQSQVGSYSKP